MKARRIAGPLLLLLTIASFGMWVHGAVPDVPTGQWLPGPALAQPREGAVSVALDDGRVLVIGGRTASGPVSTVEVFDANGSLAVGAHLLATRGTHSDQAARWQRPRGRGQDARDDGGRQRPGNRGNRDELRRSLRPERGCLVSGGVAVNRAQRAHSDRGCRWPRGGSRRRGQRTGRHSTRSRCSIPRDRGVLLARPSLGGAYRTRRCSSWQLRRCSLPGPQRKRGVEHGRRR